MLTALQRVLTSMEYLASFGVAYLIPLPKMKHGDRSKIGRLAWTLEGFLDASSELRTTSAPIKLLSKALTRRHSWHGRIHDQGVSFYPDRASLVGALWTVEVSRIKFCLSWDVKGIPPSTSGHFVCEVVSSTRSWNKWFIIQVSLSLNCAAMEGQRGTTESILISDRTCP